MKGVSDGKTKKSRPRGGERSHRSFYHIGISPQTPTSGVRVFDSYGIRATKLGLNLRKSGLNKRMHFTCECSTLDVSSEVVSQVPEKPNGTREV